MEQIDDELDNVLQVEEFVIKISKIHSSPICVVSHLSKTRINAFVAPSFKCCAYKHTHETPLQEKFQKSQILHDGQGLFLPAVFTGFLPPKDPC